VPGCVGITTARGTATLDFLRDRDVAAAPGEPAWVDAELQDARWVRRLELDDCGRPQRIHDTEQGQSDLAYDGAGRIASVQHQGSRGESYGFSPSGDVYEIGPDAPARRYAPGGRLLERGDERYEYDLDGNMVRRYRLTGVERLDEWRYEWNAAGLLSAVERPDGHRVENVYDALARRVAQRVLGAQKPVVEKRFVWDGDALVHEIIRRSEASWDPVEEVKSYVFDDNGLTLLALRTGDGPWHFAVPAAQPDLLFDETGQITSQATTSVWGDATWTSTAQSPVGLPGHYFDAETGLIYNRHRYYDPHLGRYISPDPAGVEGGIHLYAYAESRPHELMDPLGVYARTTIVDRDGNVIGRGRSKDPKKQQIHPAVGGGVSASAWRNEPVGDHRTARWLRRARGDEQLSLRGRAGAAAGEPQPQYQRRAGQPSEGARPGYRPTAFARRPTEPLAPIPQTRIWLPARTVAGCSLACAACTAVCPPTRQRPGIPALPIRRPPNRIRWCASRATTRTIKLASWPTRGGGVTRHGEGD
jgi:RHS repeat-associated protein